MALKDWEKIKINTWKQKKLPMDLIFINRTPWRIYPYEVVKNSFAHPFGIPLDGFKSKAQALKFAKQYMREN